MSQNAIYQDISSEELIEAGFIPAQIERLKQLRASYPLIELVESHELVQLRFLKWLHDHGRYPGP